MLPDRVSNPGPLARGMTILMNCKILVHSDLEVT